MKVSINGELWGVYGKDFEDYICRQLQDLGFECFTSVYANYLDIESQIDVVALCRYTILCIECKSWNIEDVYIDPTSARWIYTTPQGELKQAGNPVRQSLNHAETLRRELEQQLGGMIKSKYNESIYPCYSATIMCGTAQKTQLRISCQKNDNIYFCNDIKQLAERYYLKNIGDTDSGILKLYSEYLKSKQDDSIEKLEQHSLYLKSCKKNKLGLWRGTMNMRTLGV